MEAIYVTKVQESVTEAYNQTMIDFKKKKKKEEKELIRWEMQKGISDAYIKIKEWKPLISSR